jgi:outer membrane protein, heavy metal efflux system
MRSRRTRIFVWAVAVVIVTSACATVRVPPAPLAPEQTIADFGARTLESANLRDFVQAAVNDPALAWPPVEWDLNTLTLAALYYHPVLDVARAGWRETQAAIITAGGRPNPDFGFTASFVRGGDPGVVPWILQPSVAFVVETAGKRGHRIAQAEARSEAGRLAIADVAWNVRSAVRGHLLDHALAVRELEVVRAEEAIRADYTGALQTKLDFGDASRQEVDLARLELQRLRVAVRAAENRVQETRVALAGAVGVRAASLDAARITHPSLDTFPPLETLDIASLERNALLARTDILGALATYQAAEAAVRLEVARQFPDLQLGPGFRWRETERRWVFDIGLPIPLLNRNDGPIAEAVARRARAATDVLALQAAAVDAIARSSSRYAGALRELHTARDVLTAADTRHTGVREQFELGDVDRTAILGADLEVNVARAHVTAAVRKAQMDLGTLEQALQRPLEAGVRPFVSPETEATR